MTFNEIYKKYNKTVFNFLNIRIKDQLLAEELAGDVMIRVYKNLHLYDEQISNMNTWIMNITKNLMIDHFRRKQLDVVSLENVYVGWENGEEDAQIDRLIALEDHDLNPEEIMIEDETKTRLMKKFENLPDSVKTVAHMHYFDGLSHEEVANELNIPLGTVKAKLHHARTQMFSVVPVELR